MADTLAERFEFAHRLADAAGHIIRPYFRKRIDVTDKGSAGFYDPVTEADRRAEAAIRDLIQVHYPQDAVLGEELGAVPGTTPYRWVIDPIDGTRAFIAGQPLWGTLIGLERERVPVFGILDQPFLAERFVGFGGSAELQSKDGMTPLTTRECERLADAVICTTHPMDHFNEAERAQFACVEKVCRLSRYGGDCYAYGLIALGFVDLVMEARLAHWDIAPLIPIVEGAGGVLTDWQGKPWHAGANVLAAGDRRIHAQAVALLAVGG
jgi:myo-inositol-1(or 4)-monophosphatase